MAQWQQGMADGPTPGQALVLHQQLMLCAEPLDQGDAATAHAAALRTLAADARLTPAQRADALIAVAGHCARCRRASDALAIVEGLPPTLNDTQQASALAARAVALRELGRIDDAAAATQAALAMPGLQGTERAGLLDAQVLVEHRSGRIRAAFELNQSLILLCAQLGDAFGEMRGRYRRGSFLIELGELAAAEPELRAAADQCARQGITHLQRAVLYGLASLHSMRREQRQALACVQQGWALQPAMPTGDLRVRYHLAFMTLHTNLGELGEAWPHVLNAIDDALRGAEPYTVASVAISTLGHLALFGEQAHAAPLLARLDEPLLRQMPQVANEIWLARAQFELHSGQIEAANRALAQAPASSQIINPYLRLSFVQVQAEIALAAGMPAQALALLPADDAPGMDGGLRLQSLAVRVRAQTLGGALDAGTVAAAQALLHDRATTAVASLKLRRALAAARAAGAAGAPADAQLACTTHLNQLAASLHAYPVQQAAFMRLWA
jgi:tetratricopeptide (TPR) repeat protein